VLDVHSRVGELEHSLATLDNCRVSWGRVARVEAGELVVHRQPLVLREGKLALGESQLERVTRQVQGRGFADAAQPDDWVSLHWGWACEVLAERQVANLERFTRYHLNIANRTI
jgi:hypothetical protein